MAVGHYENFPVASLLLPAPLREPIESSTASRAARTISPTKATILRKYACTD